MKVTEDKMERLTITYGSLTNKGERKINEDYLDILRSPKRMAFILCDGLGGHGKGEIASQFVVCKMKETLDNGVNIEDSIMEAQNALREKQILEHAEDSMKTTVTCLTIEGNVARYGYVGDSRIYYFEKDKYKSRSQDHSVPQMLVNMGRIKEKDIRYHEDRSRLLRVMGTEWDTPKYQIIENLIITKYTSFLLCSDGFWELIDEKMMCRTLKKAKTPTEWLVRMKDIVQTNGKGTNMDNYSAIAVFVR